MKVRLLALAAGLAATTAQAQLIVGNDQSGSASIYHIDVTTGVNTILYTSSTNEAKPWGMAYDPATNTLYWNNGGTLYSSPYGNPLVPTTLGPMTFNGTSVNFVALAFRNGKLLGTRNIATEAVYEIDPVTLVATQLYVYNTAYDFGGLDVDVTNQKLYGLSDSAPAGEVRGLYEINVPGQSTSFIAGYPGTETDIDGLAVHDGKAYYVTDGPNTVQAFFYVYDVATGNQIGTLPSPFIGSGTFSAAAFVAPGAPACYANCDGSTGTPLLTANDFQCFLNKYAANDTYANCDGSTGNPLLTANDFQCFLNKYAAGCS
ncbi:MAG: hypothetical protein KF678_02885 [Phycisphaeraceae bacterium]|nr:hypothetical protein [Phycisphaeraceae bacterium]